MTTHIVTENTSAQNGSGTIYSGVVDTYISSLAADTNNNGAGDLRVDVLSAAKRQASLIGFTIPAAPAGEVLQSALLYLYQTYNAGVAGSVHCRPTLPAWVVDEATWNVWATGSSWTTAGAQSDGNDRIAAPSDSLVIPTGFGTGNDAYVSLDVTDDIGTYSAWLLDPDAGADVSLNWDDSEGTDGQRPELVLIYVPSGPSFNSGPTVDQITQGGARIRATGDLP